MKLWSEIATHFLGNGNTNLKDPDMKVTMVELHDMYLTEEKSVKRDDAHKWKTHDRFSFFIFFFPLT